MEPITREEYYLAKIAGTYEGNTPEPVTIEEYYLATMAGDYSGNTPQPVTRLQYYMAKVAGVWGGSVPAPVTREEYYWAAIANGEGKVFPPVTREEHFLVLVADAYSVVLTVVTGNPALLENSKGNRGLESLTLYGKSTQGSTTGAQLFDKSKAFSGWVNSDGSIKNEGTVGKGDNIVSEYIPFEAGKQYYCRSVFVWIYNTEKGFVKKADTELKDEVFTSPDNAGFFVVAFSISAEEALAKLNEIMINVGSVRKPYEPYTGGKPSPSPEYPQEIKSAGQDGEIEVEVLGKNLIPFPYPILGGAGTQIEREGVKYTVQSDGGIRCVGTPTAIEYINLSRIKFSDVGLTATHPTDGKIVLSGEKMNYDPNNHALFIYITSDQLGKPIDTVIYPQIEFGTVDTEYEPYKPAQKLIIPTSGGLPGIPVSSGGNYTDEKGQQWVADEIDLAKGERVQRIGKTVVDGEKVKFVASSNSVYWNLPFKTSPGIISGSPCTSRYFAEEKFWANNSYDFVWTTPGKMKPYFDTSEELNAFCVQKNSEGNPLTIYYCIETPIRTPLSPETIAAYKALRTYSPTTTVINDAGAGMSVGYAKMK